MLETWEQLRESRYVRALAIERGYFELGDYEKHMHWFAIRERDRDSLVFVPMELRDRPDYWNRLADWVVEQPDQVRARLETVNKHRNLIDRVVRKLVLPYDFVI